MSPSEEKPRLSWRSEVARKVFRCRELNPSVLLFAYEEVLEEQRGQGRIYACQLLQGLIKGIVNRLSRELSEEEIDPQLKSLITEAEFALNSFSDLGKALKNLLLIYEGYLTLTTKEREPFRLKEDAEALLLRDLWEAL
jgi:hypothetical protein